MRATLRARRPRRGGFAAAAAAFWIAAAAAFWIGAGLSSPGRAAEFAGASSFDAPALLHGRQAAAALLDRGDAAGAAALLDALLARAPEAPSLLALRAAAAAAAGDAVAAARFLDRAVALGFDAAPALLATPPFAGVAQAPALAAVRERRPGRAPAGAALVPAVAADGRVLIGAEAARFEPRAGLFEIAVRIPPLPSRDAGVVFDGGDRRLAAALERMRRETGAAGNAGDLYDNRDRGHSRLRAADWRRLTAVEYGEAARRAGLDYGLNDRLRFTATVIGNSSTAISDSRIARSLPRYAMTRAGVVARLQALYESNHLYVYPAHRDHRRADGDLMPAATPFMVVSQGSSGSDRPFLAAMAAALAAMRPEVKEHLRARGLIAPTLQMLLRRSLAPEEADYLDGAAHPSAFDGAALDPVRIALLANALTVADAPPLARFAVLEEPAPLDGVEIFGDGLTERLFDAPSAAARVAQGSARTRRYVLDASPSLAGDEDRPLRVVWRLLRGDPGRVRIEPLDARGLRVAVSIDWHERGAAPGGPEIATDRVDVGLFVGTATQLSAPAFFSLHFPPRQARRHDADGRVLSIDYADAARADRREDRLVVPARGWRDVYSYDGRGRPTGWTRESEGATEAFTRHGLRVRARDALGRPSLAEPMAYRVLRDEVGRMRVVAEVSGPPLRYGYDGPDDALGFLDGPAEARP